jgi:hypothetical protein
MMWLAYGILLGSIATYENSHQQSAGFSSQPNQTGNAVIQQQAASQSIRGIRTD